MNYKSRKIISLTLTLSFLFANAFVLPLHAKEKQSFKYECVNPKCPNKEAKAILQILNDMLNDLARNDFEAFSKNLDDDAYLFDKTTKELISGKANIIARLKEELKEEDRNKAPLVSFVMNEPYALVTDNLGIITYCAIKKYGGKKPKEMESRCSNVFIKRDNKWLLVQHRSDWKPLKKVKKEKSSK